MSSGSRGLTGRRPLTSASTTASSPGQTATSTAASSPSSAVLASSSSANGNLGTPYESAVSSPAPTPLTNGHYYHHGDDKADLLGRLEEGVAEGGRSSKGKSASLTNGHGPVEASSADETRKGKSRGGGGGGGDVAAEWDVLWHTFMEVLRQWKRRWDREVVPRLQARLGGNSPSLTNSRHSNGSFNASDPLSLVRQAFAIIPPRRRLLLAITTTLIALFLLLQPRSGASRASTRRHAHKRAWSILEGSGFDEAIVDRSTGLRRGVNKAKVLEGFSNPYGYINLVDPYAGGVFNPSILVLPDTVGLGWQHLLVARGAEKYEVIDGEDTRWESIVGCFLLPLKRPHLNLPYLARESDLEVLKLPAERKMDFMRCQEAVYDQFIGPEDPRLFFTNDGQPLLVYSQTGRSPNICRAIFIIDARMVIPGLRKALKRGGWDPPIVFTEQTDLIREDQSNIEKNWAPFLGERDELHFHVSLVPQQIYKYVPGLTLRPLDPNPPSHNCITDVIGAEMNRIHFHHATPLLRVTLCRRGECVPDIHNTVLFGLLHIKYHPLPYLHYERRVFTLNVTSPYEYLSVSKPLTYSGTNQADPIFTTSASWDHPTKKNGLGLNHGYLDDVLIVSFGVFDYGSAYIDVLARDMLTDHTLCAGVEGFNTAW